MGGKRGRRRSDGVPTLGEVNRAIDKLFHPHFRKGPLPIVADSLAHSIVERDPPKSVEKFVEHNLGPLVREILKIVRAQSKKNAGRARRKS